MPGLPPLTEEQYALSLMIKKIRQRAKKVPGTFTVNPPDNLPSAEDLANSFDLTAEETSLLTGMIEEFLAIRKLNVETKSVDPTGAIRESNEDRFDEFMARQMTLPSRVKQVFSAYIDMMLPPETQKAIRKAEGMDMVPPNEIVQ